VRLAGVRGRRIAEEESVRFTIFAEVVQDGEGYDFKPKCPIRTIPERLDAGYPDRIAVLFFPN